MPRGAYGWLIEIDRILVESIRPEVLPDLLVVDPKMALDKLYAAYPDAVIVEQRRSDHRYRLVECTGCSSALDENGDHFEHSDRVFSGVTDENWSGIRVEWVFYTAEALE